VWFNEGFGRYAAIQAIANGSPAEEGSAYRARQLERLRAILDAAPPFITRMSLLVLSREASYMYSEDFRFGRNVFARGSLMAAEMDEYIQKETGGTKSLRDALRFLVARTERLQQPFEVAEFPDLVRQATGVDVRSIVERWLQPPTK
jgi:predicted metalloprotease with PDZ domain